MTLRRRVGAAAAIAVAVAVVLVAAVSYFVVRSQLVGQLDDALRAQANAIEAHAGLGAPFPSIPASAGGPAPYAEVVGPDGHVGPRVGDITVPPTPRMMAVAAGGSGPYLTDVRVGNSHLRVLVFQSPVTPTGQTIAVVLARPLNSIDHVLTHLRLILLLLCLGGVGLAIVLGRLAAGRVLAPLAEVAATAQHITKTEDLTSRIDVRTDDEVGQLATRFNAMLERLEASRDALDESARAQRQLIADASHELRTPVTSLRTNIELLLEHDHLEADERRRMLADVVEQTEELSALVGDLIELARGDLPPDSVEDVRLDDVVAESVHRAERNFPHVHFEQTLSPVLVEGVPDRLSRAVNNLLDNAARHSPPNGVVEVAVENHAVRVRDHGPGVSEADMPYVFDRFYRGAGARGRHGSGLGLSIVRQVAQQHRGSVSVENAPDGGAVFTFRLGAAASGSGRPGDPSVASSTEALAQQPEADGEHRDHHQQERAAVQRAAE
jgi:two-component system, OmpR family, sensor histidine kinase MprB